MTPDRGEGWLVAIGLGLMSLLGGGWALLAKVVELRRSSPADMTKAAAEMVEASGAATGSLAEAVERISGQLSDVQGRCAALEADKAGLREELRLCHAGHANCDRRVKGLQLRCAKAEAAVKKLEKGLIDVATGKGLVPVHTPGLVAGDLGGGKGRGK